MEQIKFWFKREAETLKRLKGRQLRFYIWDYYKIPIFAMLFLIALAISALLFASDSKKVDVNIVLVNAYTEAQIQEVFDELYEKVDGYKADNRVAVDANYSLKFTNADEQDGYTIQALAALFGMGGMDIFVSNKEVFDAYVDKDGFEDLTPYLLPEEIARLEPLLFRCTNTKGQNIIAGVWLNEESIMLERGCYNTPVIIGVAAQAQDPIKAVQLLLETTR